MENFYSKLKKDKIDICNICGCTSELTWEHVPPKCCDNFYDVIINPIFNFTNSNYNFISQNGIKFRTICSNCNNNILGANADKALQLFYEQTKNYVENIKSLTDTKTISINIIQVLKCLFGKFLAMGNTYQKDNVSNSMRDFILKNILNPNLHVYFRIYPYNTLFLARSYSPKQVFGEFYSTRGFISILNFYPMAFIVSNEKESLDLIDLTELVDFKNPEKDIILSALSAYNPKTKDILPYNWLADVKDGYIILSSDDFININGFKRKRR